MDDGCMDDDSNCGSVLESFIFIIFFIFVHFLHFSLGKKKQGEGVCGGSGGGGGGGVLLIGQPQGSLSDSGGSFWLF